MSDSKTKPLVGPRSYRTKWDNPMALFSILGIACFLIGVGINDKWIGVGGYFFGLIAATFCAIMHAVTNAKRRKASESIEGA